MISPSKTVLCHYHYDPLDRLINHALPDLPERQRFYCKSRLATEIQGANRYSVFQHDDQLLAQHQSEGDALDATLLATDQQRSVLQTLNAEHPRQPIAYSPYGHRCVENGLLSLLGFNGERPDPVTGHYLLGNGYRAFNPVLMRFNSPDSWSPFGKGGLNPYVYCAGNPIHCTDSSGHAPFKLINVISNNISVSDYIPPIKTRISSLTFKPKINSQSYSIIQTDTTSSTLISYSERIDNFNGTPGGFIEATQTVANGNIETNYVFNSGDTTVFFGPARPTTKYPNDIKLRNLAYSKLKPSDLSEFMRGFAANKTGVPYEIDEINLDNYASKLKHKKPHFTDAQITKKVTAKAMLGNIRGVLKPLR
nr:RHS repeat-associated core domain-containing protein [uncultured Pseudomonas sp.]